MTITGKIIQILEPQTGTSSNGSWTKQPFIFETDGQFPKKISCVIWSDKIIHDHLKIGVHLRINFDIESREYSGRWYTDIKVWKTELYSNITSDDNSNVNSNNSTIDDSDDPF